MLEPMQHLHAELPRYLVRVRVRARVRVRDLTLTLTVTLTLTLTLALTLTKAEKGDSLSSEDLQRFRKQEQIIGQILVAYDEQPSDPDKVAALMQEMQQCGPPPAEIAGPIAGLDGLSGGCVVS